MASLKSSPSFCCGNHDHDGSLAYLNFWLYFLLENIENCHPRKRSRSCTLAPTLSIAPLLMQEMFQSTHSWCCIHRSCTSHLNHRQCSSFGLPHQQGTLIPDPIPHVFLLPQTAMRVARVFGLPRIPDEDLLKKISSSQHGRRTRANPVEQGDTSSESDAGSSKGKRIVFVQHRQTEHCVK
jgi:hypothetical protein